MAAPVEPGIYYIASVGYPGIIVDLYSSQPNGNLIGFSKTPTSNQQVRSIVDFNLTDHLAHYFWDGLIYLVGTEIHRRKRLYVPSPICNPPICLHDRKQCNKTYMFR
jgi:hypothetical protein